MTFVVVWTATRLVLPFLLIVMAVLLLIAAILIRNAPEPVPLPRFEFGGEALCVGFGVIALLLCVRLFLASNFHGSPSDLDFGWKVCTMEGRCKQDKAFEHWQSFGHASQGAMSLLLFPAMDVVWQRHVEWRGLSDAKVEENVESFIKTKEVLAPAVAIYPVYNVLKRVFLRNNLYTFATSSINSNACEWASGYTLGICLGMVFTAYAGHTGGAPVAQIRGSPTMQYIHCISGAALLSTAATSGTLLWLSWEHAPSQRAEKDEHYSEPLFAVIIVAFIAWFIHARKRCSRRCQRLVEACRRRCGGRPPEEDVPLTHTQHYQGDNRGVSAEAAARPSCEGSLELCLQPAPAG